MRRLATLLWTLIFVCLVSPDARAEKRVALVIGNSGYSNISALTNPKNDAQLMARTLESLGFDVVLTTDANRIEMGRAIRKFGKTLRGSGKDAVGLLYYAGHGVQARGVNYLVPIGAEIETHADLSLEAVSASDILAQMEAAGNRLNLVILDACRNDPFKGKIRGGSRGLARIQAASGSMVAFAAAPGQVAFDGDGANSPYTAALASMMRQPGLSVEQVFKRVRVTVEEQTGGAQTPWEESSLRGEFYFNSTSQVQTPTQDQNAVELTYWNTIKDSGDPELLNIYLKRYPQGLFAELARRMIQRLETAETDDAQQAAERAEATRRAADVAYWEAVSDTSDPSLLRSYLERFPDGVFVDIAKLRLKQLEADTVPESDPFDEQQIALAEPSTSSDAPAATTASEPSKPIELPLAEAETDAEVSTTRAKPTAPAKPKPDNQQIALATPGANAETEPDPELPRKIQTALAKFGCNPGPVDGKWGRRSKAALDRFARYAKVSVPGEPVSEETLKLFEGREGRICPLVCGRRQVEQNGRCVAKSCPAGQILDAAGVCRNRPNQARQQTAPVQPVTPQKKKRPPKWGRTGCDVVGNSSLDC